MDKCQECRYNGRAGGRKCMGDKGLNQNSK